MFNDWSGDGFVSGGECFFGFSPCGASDGFKDVECFGDFGFDCLAVFEKFEFRVKCDAKYFGVFGGWNGCLVYSE